VNRKKKTRPTAEKLQEGGLMAEKKKKRTRAFVREGLCKGRGPRRWGGKKKMGIMAEKKKCEKQVVGVAKKSQRENTTARGKTAFLIEKILGGGKSTMWKLWGKEHWCSHFCGGFRERGRAGKGRKSFSS